MVNQALITLTEFCQGPCVENQNALAAHDSNGMDIVVSLVLNEIRPLADSRAELALALKNNAAKLLLAVLESRTDGAADRVLRHMAQMGASGPRLLVRAIANAYDASASAHFQLEQVRSDHWSHLPPGNGMIDSLPLIHCRPIFFSPPNT